ncbi:MAG: hypothetical protein ACLQMH_01200 [Solirubrobacteraceae bacterium]
MLAYIFWHRPAPGVEVAAYEGALEHFHRSLAHRPPSGFAGSASFRVPELPWLGEAGGSGPSMGYEDWYLLDSWSAVGVLEEASVSRGHVGAHDALAAKAGVSTGAVYRLIEGHAGLDAVRLGVWVTPASGHEPPAIAALLGDGMDPAGAGLWRRCIALGPGPEYCLLAAEPSAGVADTRLPRGWSVISVSKDAVFGG